MIFIYRFIYFLNIDYDRILLIKKYYIKRKKNNQQQVFLNEINLKLTRNKSYKIFVL